MRQQLSLTLPSSIRAAGLALFCLGGTLALIACGNSNKTDTASVASGGVRKACDVRKSWQHAIRQECTACKAKSTTPKCTSCNVKPYSGVCADQEKARRDEPSCDGLEVCLFRCRDDCDCVDKCYADKAACEKVAGLVDECVNKTCEAFCK